MSASLEQVSTNNKCIALLPAHSDISNGIVVVLMTGTDVPLRLVPFSYMYTVYR